VYDNINQQLRRVFDDFVSRVEAAVAAATSRSPVLPVVATRSRPEAQPKVDITEEPELKSPAVLPERSVPQVPTAGSSGAAGHPPDEPW
jgi:hypothetical protein